MSVMRIARPRVLRPHLSLRYQRLRRHESTTPSPRPTTQSFFRRNLSSIVWSTLALGLGFGATSLALTFVNPPPLPQQGTHADNLLMADLNKRIDEEFRVKVLRGKCLGVTKQLKGEQGGWVEIVPSVSAGHERSGMLPFHDRLVDALQGAKGLGVERLFWDRGDKKLVAVVWFGGALSGWPGVTHGGLLATAMTEKIALAASLADGGDSNVNAAVAPQRLPGTGNHATMRAPTAVPQEPAQLSIDYLKPTYANKFHIVRVQPAWATDDNVRLEIPRHEYVATIETTDGKICVRAAAKFEPRTEMERVEEKVKEKIGWSYQEFKEWMWPSRQQQSQMG